MKEEDAFEEFSDEEITNQWDKWIEKLSLEDYLKAVYMMKNIEYPAIYVSTVPMRKSHMKIDDLKIRIEKIRNNL